MKDIFQLDIITPEKILVSEEVESFEAPGVDGEFQILTGHTPFLTSLTIGTVILRKTGQKKFVSISGGFCEVMPDKTVILAQTAELSDKIDKVRTEAARDRAKKRLESKDSTIDTERARLALMRALNRLKVTGMK
ncbi:F0F1 ATP synthase subunit epsilon [Candidatus Latescibacterota bacterium]